MGWDVATQGEKGSWKAAGLYNTLLASFVLRLAGLLGYKLSSGTGEQAAGAPL